MTDVAAAPVMESLARRPVALETDLRATTATRVGSGRAAGTGRGHRSAGPRRRPRPAVSRGPPRRARSRGSTTVVGSASEARRRRPRRDVLERGGADRHRWSPACGSSCRASYLAPSVAVASGPSPLRWSGSTPPFGLPADGTCWSPPGRALTGSHPPWRWLPGPPLPVGIHGSDGGRLEAWGRRPGGDGHRPWGCPAARPGPRVPGPAPASVRPGAPPEHEVAVPTHLGRPVDSRRGRFAPPPTHPASGRRLAGRRVAEPSGAAGARQGHDEVPAWPKTKERKRRDEQSIVGPAGIEPATNGL